MKNKSIADVNKSIISVYYDKGAELAQCGKYGNGIGGKIRAFEEHYPIKDYGGTKEWTDFLSGWNDSFMAQRPDFVKPDSMWLVVYECIYRVIEVSPNGKGFFACGQEPLWSFDNVTEWIKEIKIPALEGVKPA